MVSWAEQLLVLNCIEEAQCQNGWWQNSIISASKHFSSWSKYVLVMNKTSLQGVFWTGGFDACEFNSILEVQTVVWPVGFGLSWRVLFILIFVSFFFFLLKYSDWKVHHSFYFLMPLYLWFNEVLEDFWHTSNMLYFCHECWPYVETQAWVSLKCGLLTWAPQVLS